MDCSYIHPLQYSLGAPRYHCIAEEFNIAACYRNISSNISHHLSNVLNEARLPFRLSLKNHDIRIMARKSQDINHRTVITDQEDHHSHD
ncbi:hypothetical protein HYQ46_013134 [Verticillium longisporum]|nr:hypothetical protein HYQ46_013134 [Verticillium longisporum]